MAKSSVAVDKLPEKRLDLSDQKMVSRLTGLDCSKDVVITRQADSEACDINNIMKKYEKTGALPDLIKSNPQYGDFSQVGDFMNAIMIVDRAETQFEALDAHIRARFDNDPAKFLAFATDPLNVDEMVKLGLAKERPVEGGVNSPSSPSPASSKPPAGEGPKA